MEEEKKGTLLVVNEGSLLLEGYNRSGTKNSPALIRVRFDSLRQVDVEGESYGEAGAAVGFMVGGPIGTAASKSSWRGDAGGFIAGAIVGGYVGSLVPSDSAVIIADSPADFFVLRKYARCDNEQDYVNSLH